VNNKRPVNLDLRSLSYPPMAIVSILHRVSGIVLFLLFPLLLYFAHLSVQSEASFLHLMSVFNHPAGKFFAWVFLSALIFHLLAGIRHIFMDLGVGETLSAGRQSALVVIVSSFIFSILLGLWLC
jgi:succinate dehydrogenase / fumarate reductase cytochrome b subunit